MSILGALFTAVSGINAQSRSIGHISDNIANSQTTGYKKVDTRFVNLLTVSNAELHQPGGVIASPKFANSVQGNITQSQINSNAAISGSGFFVVSKPETQNGSSTTFNLLSYYTRSGDFDVNRDGYLVNGGNYYLNGWNIDQTSGVPDTSTLAPIQITQVIDEPTPTSSIDFVGNLPASSPVNPTPPLAPNNIRIYDALGNPHTVSLVWAKRADNIWKLDVQVPDSTLDPVSGTLIGANDQTTLYANVTPNVAPVAQVDTATLPDWLPPGRTLSFSSGSNTVSITAPATGYNATQAASALASAINGNAGLAQDLTAANIITNSFDVTSDTPGTSFASALSGTGTGQTDTLVLGGGLATGADTLSYTIGATTVTITGPLTSAQSAAALVSAINGDVTLSAAVTAYVDPTSNTRVYIQSDASFGIFAGTVGGTASGSVTTSTSAPANIANSVANVPPVAQVDSITLGGTIGATEIGDTYTLTIGTQSVSYVSDGTETSLNDLANRFATLINANPALGVTASTAGNVVNLTATNPGVAFTGASSAANGSVDAFIDVQFGDTADTAGKIIQVSNQFNPSGNASIPVAQTNGQDIDIDFLVDFGVGPQTITLNLGQFQNASGVTQFAGTNIDVSRLTQDGLPQGNLKDIAFRKNGDVVLNYDNGRSRAYFRVPIAQFYDPNTLKREDSQAFTETFESGSARLSDPGANGSGALTPSALEGSNVDIAEEFSKMIVTQRAYAANTRVITTADDMLNEIINIRR